MTPAGRQRRETVRMQAAELFEQKIKPPEVARRLRVSPKSAHQWHQLWRDGGVQALASRGPSRSRCRLSPRCLEKLAAYLDEGPAAHGWVEASARAKPTPTTVPPRSPRKDQKCRSQDSGAEWGVPPHDSRGRRTHRPIAVNPPLLSTPPAKTPSSDVPSLTPTHRHKPSTSQSRPRVEEFSCPPLHAGCRRRPQGDLGALPGGQAGPSRVCQRPSTTDQVPVCLSALGMSRTGEGGARGRRTRRVRTARLGWQL